MNVRADTISPDIYQSLLLKHEAKANVLKSNLNWFSFLRLLCFCAFLVLGYKAMRTGDHAFTILSLISLAGFFILLKLYDKCQSKIAFYNALAQINRNEINFLNAGYSAYPDGKEYIDPHHPYSYDLDIFGEKGLFAYLNRTGTSFGQQALAQSLLDPDKKNITARQEAILDLVPRLEFRQELQAHGMTQDTKQKEMQQLKTWIDAAPLFSNKYLYYSLMIFPLATLFSLAWHFVTGNDAALNLFMGLFMVNLLIAFSFFRKIAAHLSVSTSVNKVLQQFALQLQKLESQDFQSGLLKELQEKLKTGNSSASRTIARLASLFNSIETAINLMVSILLNGLVLFHIHVLFALEKWKSRHSAKIMPWLKVLGEAESLCSYANLSYNNPDFCRPILNENEAFSADEMGHPLIAARKRINNSVSFTRQPFVILTGSNMSGKSTFLRTLGINLVLANAGSMICASRFEFYPYEVQVSMRISDSLQDSESFFYAELKRLQQIIHQLEAGHKSFVILDEILRGTNSNDKHSGTIGLIRKLVAAHACGIIATHDLSVAKLSEEYSHYISNKCFESKIINDELLFDYKLHDDVCTTLSASFLMKKMKII